MLSASDSGSESSEVQVESWAFTETPQLDDLRYAVTHVFLPVELPRESEYDVLGMDCSLARIVCAAAHVYSTHVRGALEQARWHRITKMLDNLQSSVQSDHPDNDHVISQLHTMQAGDILTFFCRPQNAAIMLTKQEDCTLYESFEVSPSGDAVDNTAGSLICSYPRSAVEIPNHIFHDADFQFEFASFLSSPGPAESDIHLHPPHSQCITALLTGIVRSVGRATHVVRITKRVRGHVSKFAPRSDQDTAWIATFGYRRPRGDDLLLPRADWHRSSLWLLMRVVIQMSVDRSPLGRALFKEFMVFVLCKLAEDPDNKNLSSDLLHLMLSKILRRLGKLGSFTPVWLSETALKTCSRLRDILDDRWRRTNTRPSLFRNPSQDELIRDTQLSLLSSHRYIQRALADPGHRPDSIPFLPANSCRGTLQDFLSSDPTFFMEAYATDPHVTLYAIEQSVEKGIDDWVACVTDVDEACAQLEVLMDYYMMAAAQCRVLNPEDTSITLLMALELFVALDKLIIMEIPILADYSPEIPICFLERLLLCKTTSLNRLSCAYRYLSERHSCSRPGWSVLSNQFTADSFPVRFYDRSLHLQHLKARIEQDAVTDNTVQCASASDHDECQEHQTLHEEQSGVSQSPLPASPLQAKALVFELQCPTCIRAWRAASPRILFYFYKFLPEDADLSPEDPESLLADVPELQLYFVEREGPLLFVQIHCIYLHPGGSHSEAYNPDDATLRYAIQHPCKHDRSFLAFSRWCPMRYHDDKQSSYHLKYQLQSHNEKHVISTSYTPNDVLAAQADCPPDLSLDEFITVASLRSGGSLQWLNVLRGLRSGTLNLCRDQVYFLLARAAFQVGPLDLDTGVWSWHQELQDLSFCDALVDELYSFVQDVGVRSVDGLMMSTCSLLLTRVHASSPSESISARVLELLRHIRRTTFNWVQGLSYDVTQAPMDEGRRNILQNMAATCRSTFDVDSAMLCASAVDVDAFLSSASFVYTLRPKFIHDEYSRLLLERDRRLSVVLEDPLRNSILADMSDHGIDLAIGRIFASHQPSACKWEPLGHAIERLVTCRTKATMDQPSRTLHLDLLDGTLQVEGQILGGLPHQIMAMERRWQEIFRDQGFFVLPSDLPGMDFTTLVVSSKYKVHFSLQDPYPMIRAQCNQTGEILQLIPSSLLREDLPPALVDEHVHWLNLSTKVIEIRPLTRLWERSSENWRIDCSSEQCYVYKGRETLVDVRSPTWKMVSKCFECLNGIADNKDTKYNNFLITTLPFVSHRFEPAFQLSITLPRYSLSFYVNGDGELESRDFKDMVYDENQCIGTLFGLENLLVLRQRSHMADELIFRRVLIPNGSPVMHNDHQVRLDSSAVNSANNEPLYHIYEVDTEMGCLTGSCGSTSMEYLGRLHTATNYYLPDPLTGKTGAQAALLLSQAAGCRLSMKLEASGGTRSTQNISELRSARRAAYRFPWSATEFVSLDLRKCNDLDCSNPEPELEFQEIVSTAASAVYRWSTSTPTMDTILTWAKMWRSDESTPDDLILMLIKTSHDILGKRKGSSLQFGLLFLLPLMAYCSPLHQPAFLSMLLAFTQHLQSHLGSTPIHANFEISHGYRPTEEVLRCRTFWSWHFKRRCLARDPKKHDLDAIVQRLLEEWPSDTTPFLDSLNLCCWAAPDDQSLTAVLQPFLVGCHRNLKLKEQLIRILAVPGVPVPLIQVSSASQQIPSERTPPQITFDHLFSTRPAPELPARITFPPDGYKSPRAPSEDDMPTLNHLFSLFRTSHSFQREYLARLGTSAQRVHSHPQITIGGAVENLIKELEKHYTECKARYMDGLAALKGSLCPTTDPREQVLQQFGQWPPVTGDVLLRYLASTSPITPPGQWKKCLINLALLLLDLQRSRRMLRFAMDGLEEDFSNELRSEGCNGWNAEDHPDWLLIQIQGNFIIRRAQAETAMELISPRSGGNTVVQLNMGEGKSSVIIPIVAAALADGSQLVRVVVPKALMVQMLELLVGRLGWLANRPIYYLPFSRTPDPAPGFNVGTNMHVDDLHQLLTQCVAERGILLVQPEHVLSLKLMSMEQQMPKYKLAGGPSQKLHQWICQQVIKAGPLLESIDLSKDSFVGSIFGWLSPSSSRSWSNKRDATQAVDSHDKHTDDSRGSVSDDAPKWLDLQKWIHSNARDILDESDEILHTRFQLMYTIGPQQHVDGYPDRWMITQRVLRLVKEHAHALARDHPDSVEYECGPPGSFPHIRIVQASGVGRYLTSLIVEDVMTGRLPDFDFGHLPSELQDAIRSFISDEDVLQVPETLKKVEEYARQGYLWNGLLLLRGLLASGILLFALAERRWRVDYGVRVSEESQYYANRFRAQSTLAVPYRAKDTPAPHTQFGHPDITILLTCLSYYYIGLTEEQLRISFEVLLNQDDTFAEYALWIDEYDRNSVPDSLRTFGEINLRSSEQWDKVIFPLFSRNKAAIDLYLSRVVFPKQAKEFPWKLSGSSWDLAEKREKPITGFSGTHDGRWLLPMSIAQRDLDHQLGTDARVLSYLLKSENNFYMVTCGHGERRTTAEFLRLIVAQEPKIRILLDVGAQVLDLSNREVAQAWITIVPDASGAIYFNEKDELMALTQTGISLPMSSSPLSLQLNRCVVYVDHAHTRGTDIKFPIGSRAAVTLGPKVTKDRLVQGCMRMRKLGRGHSVMFFAPPEVDQSIRAAVTNKDPRSQVTTADVLCWAIHETWTDIQQRAPHWAQQGMSHKSRYEAWSRFCNDEITPEQLSNAWLQPECKSLADLYAPVEAKNASNTLLAQDPGIRQRCKDLGVLSLPRAQMEEEQEREVSRETERERDVELPPPAKPMKHFLHEDVVAFVKTGVIPPLHSGSAFRPVFTTLERSSAASREADVWSSSILATTDFCQTIQPESTRGTLDQYLRPVQWILSRRKGREDLLVLLSPFEVGRLMPDIRVSEHVHLHLYAPRTSKRMKPSDDLKLYSIPPLPTDWSPPWALIDQLNVFAGQLYLRDYASYLRLCQFLGVPTKELPSDSAGARRNVFHIPGSYEEDEITFSDSPLPAVKALLAIRNRGLPFAQTHMGKIFQGKPLTENDF